MTAPTQELPQHLTALQHANVVRLRRAEVKRMFFMGEITLEGAIEDFSTASMWISDLLMVQKRWGRARVRRLLVSVGISENRQCGKLTKREKGVLVSVVDNQGE